LHELLRAGEVEKNYVALLKGRWRGGPRSVELALRKNVLRSGERVVRVSDEHGKQSASHFSPANLYAQASLMSIRPLTGRTHQIRVHAAHVGHPLAGDAKYGDKDFNRALNAYGLRRLFLHASSVRLQLPNRRTPLLVESPLPQELSQVLERLQ
jgi:23S rRNA pseudouridine955/2504/2580 synthase